TAGSDSGELEQTYLQAMYIYNTSDSLSGIGISYHDNILRTTDISAVVVETHYEPAAGLLMMYEYKRLFGDHIVGVSYTQLESENSATQAKVDMSRTEIYYRWAF
ncbi:MAG: hypothetical protein KAU21_21630, partial [Gammaproteobacteria bacterium]|nr:hypothetical protein [Gammaproteobacteria bacterium]